MGRDILQHHDSVIHDHSDGDRQSRHRNDIQRVPSGEQIDQRAQQRDRDRKDDDERGSPSSQKDEDNEHDDEESDYDSLLEGIDRVENLRRVIDDLRDLDV